MFRRFKSNAAQLRAAYLGSLLVAAAAWLARQLHVTAPTPSSPARMRAVAQSSFGHL